MEDTSTSTCLLCDYRISLPWKKGRIQILQGKVLSFMDAAYLDCETSGIFFSMIIYLHFGMVILRILLLVE
jgi:hypothetical protein